MNTTIEAIPIARLALTFLPVLVVLVLLYMWSKEARESVYGLSRMLAQLLIIAPSTPPPSPRAGQRECANPEWACGVRSSQYDPTWKQSVAKTAKGLRIHYRRPR